MSETKEPADKTLRGGAPHKPMSLQRTVESGHVRQNFSHGRSKSVVVEKRKTRKLTTPGEAAAPAAAAPAPAAPAAKAPAAESRPAERPTPTEAPQRVTGLRQAEADARTRAL